MVKIVKVGYGSQGQGVGKIGGYTYVVNDNVKPDQIIFPVATSPAGRLFATTGKVLSTAPVQAGGKIKIVDKNGNEVNIIGLQSARGLGIGTERGAGGRFVSSPTYERTADGGTVVTERGMAIRGGQLAQVQQQKMEQTGELPELTKMGQKSVEKYQTYPYTYGGKQK